MSLKHTLLAVSALASLAFAPAAFAQPAWHGGFHEALAAAGLTPSQQQQIRQIMQAARTQDAPQRTQLQALHQQIEQTLFSSGDVTAAQLTPLVQQEEALRQQLDASRVQAALAVRALLTPAQLARAAGAEAQLASLHQQEQAIAHPSGD